MDLASRELIRSGSTVIVGIVLGCVRKPSGRELSQFYGFSLAFSMSTYA